MASRYLASLKSRCNRDVLSGTPIAALAGDAVVHHFRKIYHAQLILNVGISREHATELIAAGLGDFVTFGREYIANPELSLDTKIRDDKVVLL